MNATGSLREVLEASFVEALASLDATSLVSAALPPLPPKRARVRVIAAGKAAVRMTAGALRRWPDRIDDALVVTPVGDASSEIDDPRVRILRAPHPLPDERSVHAAEEAIRRARELAAKDLLLVLLSGGASSVMSAPPDGFAIDRKRALLADLFASGAPITDVNEIRRHLSRVKGGRLALAAHPARTLTLYTSDVVEGRACDVGSGPSVTDPTTVEDARRALERWAPTWVAEVAPHLQPSLRDTTLGVRTRAVELASPVSLGDAVARALVERGFDVAVTPPDTLDVETTALDRVARARALSPGQAVIIPCEPTLALPPERGRGGRAGRVALLAMSSLPDDVILFCGASDGVDGSSGHSGAIVTRANALAASHHARETWLASFDDASAHEALDTSLDLGPTGHNLADCHVLLRSR